MKRSEFEKKVRSYVAEPWTDASYGADQVLALVDQLAVAWDPEWPPGFEAFWLDPSMDGLRVNANQHACLAAWNACLSRQEAQQHTIEHKVDPEARRKEIEAQIDSWADDRLVVVRTRRESTAVGRERLGVL